MRQYLSEPMTRVALLLVMLFCLACLACGEEWYQKHPPLCHQETWQSLGEATGYGVALPTTIYYGAQWAYPAKTQQGRIGRIMASHAVVGVGMMIGWRNQTAWHDDDARWMNPLMACVLSMGANIVVDALIHSRDSL